MADAAVSTAEGSLVRVRIPAPAPSSDRHWQARGLGSGGTPHSATAGRRPGWTDDQRQRSLNVKLSAPIWPNASMDVPLRTIEPSASDAWPLTRWVSVQFWNVFFWV